MNSALLICNNLSAETKTTEPQMRPITFEEWKLKREKYLPNILVVDLWAMWCISCIERFPEIVRLHHEYKDRNVKFVSMNLDDREDTQSLEIAENFLAKMNAQFDHYRMNENLLVAFEKINLFGIPAVIIYDEYGEERFRLTGDNPNKQFTEDDIEAAINDLM